MEKKTSELTRILHKYLGPKQIRPIPTASFISVLSWVFLATSQIAAVEKPTEGLSRRVFAESFPAFLITWLGVYLSLVLFRKLQKERPKWGWVFYSANLFVALIALAERQFLTLFFMSPSPAWSLSGNQISFVVFIFSVGIFVQQTIGISTQRLEFENKRANKALADLEKQQQLLIYSQEELRRELATYLHDGLQSNLVVLGLQMKQASDGLPKKYQGIGNSFIEELERMRRIDVKTAIRQLSPDLETLSLRASLKELAKRFEKVMAVSFSLDSTIESKETRRELKLGAYRIIEQALLNALVHGHAQNCAVSIEYSNQWLEVEISNDGSSVNSDFQVGSGLAIIDAWAKSLGGSHSLRSSEQGTVLSAKLAL